MKVKDLMIRIGADPDNLRRGLGNAKKEVQRFSKDITGHMDRAANSIRDLGAVLATAFAFNSLKEVGLNIINLAKEAESSEATFKQVFGGMTEEARKFSEALSKTLQVNAYNMRKSMSTVNAIVKGMGLADNTALDMSKGIAQMTYDLAAFRDLSIEEAFYKLRSGLTGETEPLKEVGILVLENTIKEVAYRRGIAQTGKELTEQQKVLARYAAIQESLTRQGAVGQWIREQDQASAQAKIAKERYEQLAATVGQRLLPVYTKLLNIVNFALDRFSKLPDSVQGGVLWFGVAAVALVGLTFALGAVLAAIPFVVSGFSMLARAGKAAGVLVGRFGVVLRGVLTVASRFHPLLAIAATLVYMGSQSEWARRKVQALWDTLKGFLGVQTASASGASGQTDAVGDLTEGYQDYIDVIGGVEDGLKDAGKASEKFLASFDEVYSIPDKGGDGSGNTPPLPTLPAPPDNGGNTGGGSGTGESWIKKFLDEIKLLPKVIEMPKPMPPDGGAGAVATAWTTSVNQIVNTVSTLPERIRTGITSIPGIVTNLGTQVVQSFSNMWAAINGSTLTGTYGVTSAFNTMFSGMNSSAIAGTYSVTVAFSLMWAMINATNLSNSALLTSQWSLMNWGLVTATTLAVAAISTEWTALTNLLTADTTALATSVKNQWHGMLDYMQSQLNAYNPYLMFGWALLIQALEEIIPTNAAVSISWHEMLDFLQTDLNSYRPYLEYGLGLVVVALKGLVDSSLNTAAAWDRAWNWMLDTARTITSPILSYIDMVMSQWAAMAAMIGQPIQIPKIQMPKIELPDLSGVKSALSEASQAASSFLKDTSKNLDAFLDAGANALTLGLHNKLLKANEQSQRVENQSGAAGTAGQVFGGVVGVGKAAGAISKGSAKGKEMLEQLKQMLENLQSGRVVTGFSSGGIIGNDSIVRVGERGRREAIIPLESNAMQPFAAAIAQHMGDGGGVRDVIIQAGVVVADKRSVKEFARMIKAELINDDSRGLNR
ncbi:hypothetical protein [Paenibacillus sp. Pae108]|uniref:hypothetical protein n=1 Tax=Paenibacillus sp. Pae108 TaxID=2926019 RepID=UPI0021183705|nr:hypothetical protein [Paenibacillus sp. Pae108]